MMSNEITVRNLVSFRRAVADLKKSGETVYVKRTGQNDPVYRIISAAGSDITLTDMFDHSHPPVRVGDFALAMKIAWQNGEDVSVTVFTQPSDDQGFKC